jgi:putative transposase
LFRASWAAAPIDPTGIVLHTDNDGPIRGGSVRATRDRLGVLASLTLPGVSCDNPYSEALFRTIKYRLNFQRIAFADLASNSGWMAAFVA